VKDVADAFFRGDRRLLAPATRTKCNSRALNPALEAAWIAAGNGAGIFHARCQGEIADQVGIERKSGWK